MTQILVVYYHRYSYPMRKAVEDHLYSFDKYAGAPCTYVNAAFGIPTYLAEREWDLTIFHTTYLAQLRWSELPYETLIRRSFPLKRVGGIKAAIPQDEFLHADNVCRFFREFGVTEVFTLADPKECRRMYPDVDHRRVRFHLVLAGYLDEGTLAKIGKLKNIKREVDVGYRAFKAPPWLGKHGLLKVEIARRFQRAEGNFSRDISTEERDTFLGMDWYRFLSRCKYVLGVPGGSSLLDYDGSIRRCVDTFLEKHPQSCFEVVKAACFPQGDNTLDLKAMSPRHLEACATRTCQLLVEGDYGGVLRPWEHYIPIKSDFSNLAEVVQAVEQDTLRQEIVERAYRDVVASGEWTYQRFVQHVLTTCLLSVETKGKTSWRLKWRERLTWWALALEARVWGWVKGSAPPSMLRWIRGFRRNL